MAVSIGAALRLQRTVRPVLARSMSPARASTSRCFITAGSETAKGAAISVTASPSASRQAIEDGPARRVRERREGPVELGFRKVNHVVKYCPLLPALSSDKERTSRAVERHRPVGPAAARA